MQGDKRRRLGQAVEANGDHRDVVMGVVAGKFLNLFEHAAWDVVQAETAGAQKRVAQIALTEKAP